MPWMIPESSGELVVAADSEEPHHGRPNTWEALAAGEDSRVERLCTGGAAAWGADLHRVADSGRMETTTCHKSHLLPETEAAEEEGASYRLCRPRRCCHHPHIPASLVEAGLEARRHMAESAAAAGTGLAAADTDRRRLDIPISSAVSVSACSIATRRL